VKAPFRLGTTSYVLPAAILPNVRFLAGKVQDIELLLFEVDDVDNALPDQSVVRELGTLAAAHDLSYTVHLPLALELGRAGREADLSVKRAESVIDAFGVLEPAAYVAHLGPAPQSGAERWLERAADQLCRLSALAGDPERIAVENPGATHPCMAEVLDRTGASRCVDVGHLWHSGEDPVSELERFRPRLRLVHLHGSSRRDHQSLACVAHGKLASVTRYLLKSSFDGVVTLEVFGLDDFQDSLRAIHAALEDAWDSI
jgi:sugar phosphate isomerase/epimerase